MKVTTNAIVLSTIVLALLASSGACYEAAHEREVHGEDRMMADTKAGSVDLHSPAVDDIALVDTESSDALDSEATMAADTAEDSIHDDVTSRETALSDEAYAKTDANAEATVNSDPENTSMMDVASSDTMDATIDAEADHFVESSLEAESNAFVEPEARKDAEADAFLESEAGRDAEADAFVESEAGQDAEADAFVESEADHDAALENVDSAEQALDVSMESGEFRDNSDVSMMDLESAGPTPVATPATAPAANPATPPTNASSTTPSSNTTAPATANATAPVAAPAPTPAPNPTPAPAVVNTTASNTTATNTTATNSTINTNSTTNVSATLNATLAAALNASMSIKPLNETELAKKAKVKADRELFKKLLAEKKGKPQKTEKRAVRIHKRFATADVTFRINVDVAKYTKDPSTFKGRLHGELAKGLNVTADRIVIRSVNAGSVVVSVRILPTREHMQSHAEDLAELIKEKSRDPANPWKRFPLLGHIDRSYAIKIAVTRTAPKPKVPSVKAQMRLAIDMKTVGTMIEEFMKAFALDVTSATKMELEQCVVKKVAPYGPKDAPTHVFVKFALVPREAKLSKPPVAPQRALYILEQQLANSGSPLRTSPITKYADPLFPLVTPVAPTLVKKAAGPTWIHNPQMYREAEIKAEPAQFNSKPLVLPTLLVVPPPTF